MVSSRVGPWFVAVFILQSEMATAQYGASYQASFLFQGSSCFVTPKFEFGCLNGGTIVNEKVNLLDDTPGTLTCILHPTKGDQFLQCTATVTLGGQGAQSSLFSANFQCEGMSNDSLVASVANVPPTAQCSQSETSDQLLTYHYSSLSVYDSVEEVFVEAEVCDLGTPELVSDLILGFGCSQSGSGCDNTGSSGRCNVQLPPTRLSFNGADLPEGAIQRLGPSHEASLRRNGKVVVWSIAAVVAVFICVCAFAYICFRKAKNQQSEKGTDENTVEAMESVRKFSHRSLRKANSAQSRSSSELTRPDAADPFPARRSGAEVDANDIQRYGFSVIRKHLNGGDDKA